MWATKSFLKNNHCFHWTQLWKEWISYFLNLQVKCFFSSKIIYVLNMMFPQNLLLYHLDKRKKFNRQDCRQACEKKYQKHTTNFGHHTEIWKDNSLKSTSTPIGESYRNLALIHDYQKLNTVGIGFWTFLINILCGTRVKIFVSSLDRYELWK